MLGLAVMMLAACPDSEAQLRQQVARDFQAALVLHREAERAISLTTDEATDTRQAQRDKLAQVQSALERIRGQGSDAQKVATLRLLADIYASNARFHHEQAISHWAVLTYRDPVVSGYFTAADGAAVRIETGRFQGDDLLAKQETRQREIEQRIAALRRDIAPLNEQIQTLNRENATLEAQRSEQTAEALRLRQEAFVVSGREQHELTDQSAKAQRQADALATKMQLNQAQLNKLQAELAVLDRQATLKDEELELTLHAIAALRKQSVDARQTAQQVRGEAEQSQQVVLREMREIDDAYRGRVDAEFEEALGAIDQAIDALRQAQNLARTDQPRVAEIQNELAMRQLAKINILTSHAMTRYRHGSHLAAMQLNAPRAMSEHAAALQRELDAVRERTGAITAAAGEAIEEGTQMLENLRNEEVRQNLSDLLNTYRDRVGQVRIATVTAATPAPGIAPARPVTDTTPGITPGAVPAMTGEMPALPEIAMSEQFIGLAVMDMTQLTPQSLRATAAAVMGEAAAMLEEPLQMFDAYYAQMAAAGVKGVVMAIGVPDDPAAAQETSYLFIASDDAIDPQAVQAFVPDDQEVQVTRLGDWTMIYPQGGSFPIPASADRADQFHEALDAAARRAIHFAFVPDAEARQLAMAQMPLDESPASRLMTEKATWLSGSVALGNAPAIAVRIKMENAEDAQQLKSHIDASFDPAQAEPGDMTAMMLSQVADAVQSRAEGDMVHLDIDVRLMRPLIESGMMMFMMMMQAGGEFDGGNFDDGNGGGMDFDFTSEFEDDR